MLYLTSAADIRAARGAPEEVHGATAEVIYSLIRGPGTVGIEANGTPEDVCSVTVQALDYFGVYSISRCVSPSADDEVVQEEVLLAVDENINPNRRTTSGRGRRSKPILSKELISNRRISIGVYGLYTGDL